MTDDAAALEAGVHRASYVIPSIFLGFLAVLYVRIALLGGGYAVLACVLGFWGFVIAYLRSYRVSVAAGVLRKRTLFAVEEIPLSAIASATVRTGLPKGMEVLLPPIRLEVFARDRKVKVIVNLKLLRSQDIRRLLDIIGRGRDLAGRKFFDNR